MSNEIVVQESSLDMLPVEQIKRQTDQVKSLMASCMNDGLHYGKIPGCGDKPTLLQPGAQKLTMMFSLADNYDISREDLPNGHREYTVKCNLVSKHTGLMQGSGVGLCSTMEKKYRYRNVSDYEITDEPIPQDARERKQEYRKQGFGMKKVDGQWVWVRYMDASQQENPDIADTYNTVLKMACKRALIAAVLNTLAVSDLFTQDIDDLGEYAVDFAKPKPHDPRKEAWEQAADLKQQAIALGTKEDGINSWMTVNIVDPNGAPKPTNRYSYEDIVKLCSFLEMNIQEHEKLANESLIDDREDDFETFESDTYDLFADQDIDF